MAVANPPYQFSCHGYGDQWWDPVVVPDDPPLGSAANPIVVKDKKKKKKVHPFHADTYRQRRRTSRVAEEVRQLAFREGFDITPALAAVLAAELGLARVVIS
jgi:hypothetical protein